MAVEHEVACCVRGYHIYKDIWQGSIGDTLVCERQLSNLKDRYAVAVIEHGTVVGHLPRKVSKLCSLFLRRGGIINCVVTGRR